MNADDKLLFHPTFSQRSQIYFPQPTTNAILAVQTLITNLYQ